MIVPSAAHPVLTRFHNLRQRCVVRSFHLLATTIRRHVAHNDLGDTAGSRSSELEADTVYQAMSLVADQLYMFGRPDLASELENLYYDTLSQLPIERCA